MSSIANSTIRQYACSLKLWWSYCNSHCLDPFDVQLQPLIQFLQSRYAAGASYASLNSDRSAVSILCANNIGSDPEISRFFQGIYKLRPPKPKYDSTWDPQQVLDYLKTLYPLENLNLEQLTLKLVGLLALVTAHRVQTFASILLSDIKLNSNGAEIFISSRIKTSGPRRVQPVLNVPFFTDCPELCAGSTLQHYMQRTAAVRTTATRLLISYTKPHSDVTAQTVSRWIKKVLGNSGVDISMYSSHSTRHSATSASLRAGMNVETIRKAAGWTKNSEIFAKFYNQPLVDKHAFANSVVNPSSVL